MKNFWGTFFACLVICGVMLFFAPIFQNAWVLLAVSALVLTAPIRTLENQGDRIEALEKRIQALEQAREHNAGEANPGEEEELV